MTTTRKNDLLEEEYNRYPYESFPFFQSHPVYLHTLGKLFGLSVTPVENARILELGCASGGNLIPVAFQYPYASFLGIDLSKKEIDEGNQHINALELKNIILRHQSILDFNASEGKFDYIICHGVYSWVDNEVREKIFNLCKENLSPNGIVYISYNTYPGWNMITSIRDLMLWHTKLIDDPSTKAQQARQIANFINNGLQNNPSTYALFLKNEINLITKQTDSYLLHDHLSTYNSPVYFYQFMEKAHQNNLSYLADADLALMYIENLPPVFSNELKKIKDIIVAEQYMDFIRNQRFRSTLLCHKEAAINRALQTEDIENFYIQFSGKSDNPNLNENEIGKNKELVFRNATSTLKVQAPILQWAMFILYQNKHHLIHYNELINKISEKSDEKNLDLIKQTVNNNLNLIRAALSGLIQISTYPSHYTTIVSKQPIACPLVRYQVSIKQRFVTNRRHQAVVLSTFGTTLIPYLDGKHDLSFFENLLIQEIKSGKLKMLDANKKPIQKEEDLKKLATVFCQKELEHFAQQALLISSF